MAPRPISVRRPYNDANGDGLDDSSGLPRLEHEADDPTSTYDVNLNTGLEIGITDEDGDGRDDTTGLNQAETDAEFERVFGWRQYRDSDGDGLDDVTGENRQDFRKSELSRRSTTDFGSISTSFTDEDGDGRDDTTGWDPDTFSQLRNNANIYQAEAKDAAVTLRERERGQAEREAADQQAAADAAAAADYEEWYREYEESGQRTADLRAGRAARPRPGTPGAPGYQAPGAPAGSGGGGGKPLLSVPETGIGFADWLTGATAENAAEQAELDRLRNMERVQRLRNFQYTPEDVSIEYGQMSGDIEQAPVVTAEADQAAIESERRALAQLEDIYGSGGMTAGDRARLQQGEREVARAMRSQREADLAALRARGLGGSGASIASMLAAQQSGADLLADREAEIMKRAEDRALEAMTGSGELAGRMRNSSFDESSWNADAMNTYNKDQAQYYRDVEKYNLGAQDKTAESAADSLREQLEIEERLAGHEADVWGEGQAAQERAERRKEERYAAQAEGLAGLGEKLLDL